MLLRRFFFAVITFSMAGCARQTAQHSKLYNKNDVEQAYTEDPYAPEGLSFSLTEGAPQKVAAQTTRLAKAEPLSTAEIEKVIARLKPFKGQKHQQTFSMRTDSKPAPRTGETIEASFPPATPARPQGTPNSEVGPLEIRRFAPEGDVLIAAQMSVTFSQPMVALSTHSMLSTQDRPVRITPEPAGAFRWIGTKTILFESGERLPMATEYTVNIPAGTTSAVGGRLEQEKTWTFRTPAPRIILKHPGGGAQPLLPVLFMAFDQAINKEAVLGGLKIIVDGQPEIDKKKRWTLRWATAEEIAADPVVHRLVKAAKPGRFVALRPNEPFPPASTVRVELALGAYSVEGPRHTTRTQSINFKTYAPLRVKSHSCGQWSGACRPGDVFQVVFNNPMGTGDQGLERSEIHISPPLDGMRVSTVWPGLRIQGRSKARTTYMVRLSKNVTDKFGQKLGKDTTLEFKVGLGRPSLRGAREGLVLLDPAARGQYSIFSVNQKKIEVQIYKVEPQDFFRFLKMKSDYSGYGYLRGKLPGKRVFRKIMRLEGEADQMLETPINLAPALENGVGHALVMVKQLDKTQKFRNRRVILTWVQVTHMALDAFVDAGELVAWTTSLSDGTPMAGIALNILGSKAPTEESDADGLATLSLPEKNEARFGVLLARERSTGDTVFLPESEYWWAGNTWRQRSQRATLRWYVFDDRKMYRPKETVHVKGWLRRITPGKRGVLTALGDAAKKIGWTLRDSRSAEVAQGSTSVNAQGGFHFEIELPKSMNLGPTYLTLKAQGGKVSGTKIHSFEVQEFRRPEFEVAISGAEGPLFIAGSADLTLSASYYAGGALRTAPAGWRVMAKPGNFRPPNQNDYTFGISSRPWRSWSRSQTGRKPVELMGQTNSKGEHFAHLEFSQARPPRPFTLSVEGNVTDVNRQRWNARKTLLVHPASLYVGLRTPRPFVREGEAIEVQSIVSDLDGKRVENIDVNMQAFLLQYGFEKGEWKQNEKSVGVCSVTSKQQTENDMGRCTFASPDGGSYLIRATIKDAAGRPNQSELRVWASGSKVPPNRGVTKQKVKLIADKKEYQPEDTAQLLVIAPFAPAQGLLTLRRRGIVEKRYFSMDNGNTILNIKLNAEYIPTITAQVDLVGASRRSNDVGELNMALPPKPAYASGTLTLGVSTLTKKLRVTITPKSSALLPGTETSVGVQISDLQGGAVAGAELALVIVDEAVLALSGYTLIDPLSVFYAAWPSGVQDFHGRKALLLADPKDVLASMAPPSSNDSLLGEGSGELEFRGGAGLGSQLSRKMISTRRPSPVKAKRSREVNRKQPPLGTPSNKLAQTATIGTRVNFAPLAIFAPEVLTDVDGKATVSVRIPDNLTRYRIMVVAVSGDDTFGSAESSITARMPLMIRPSPPRFLNYGDEMELPVVLQNQTDEIMQVNVVLRAQNAKIKGAQGVRISVPPRDRAEVRFPATTTMPGTARFQIGATTHDYADAVEISLPVWTPATTEAFATYGEIDDSKTNSPVSIVQPVTPPENAEQSFGGIEITTSSTALQALTDAVIYLVNYPYDSAEQVASRILGIASLRDVLDAFNAEGLPSKAALEKGIRSDIERLMGLQGNDGGFSVWRRDRKAWPYVTVHATHALLRAKEKGFKVSPAALQRAQNYLSGIEGHVRGWLCRRCARHTIAYAAYVLKLMGKNRPDLARRIIAEKGLAGLTMESIGWVLPVLKDDGAQVQKMLRYLDNHVQETAGNASFAVTHHDGDYLIFSSSRRADAVLLDALVSNSPQNDLIPKLVHGLMAHKTRGRWGNTQENVFVLLAMNHYFARFETKTPDFVARAWLGEHYAGEHHFKGRTVERHHIGIPMPYLFKGEGTQNVVLEKQGPGRMYYRLGMKYAPKSLALEAADHGFAVERRYEAVDDENDVRQSEDGIWHFKAGSRVRVRLAMVAPSRRYHVALIDPMPAGLEAINPALKVSGSVPTDESAGTGHGRWWWWQWPWFEHQNMRDERVEAFASLLRPGVHKYTYVARATTPGRFVVPPTKAEEMYSPETFGRSASATVVIE